MARSDLLVSLVRAGASGNRKAMVSTVEAIIAEERAKQHNVLAERLTRALKKQRQRRSYRVCSAGVIRACARLHFGSHAKETSDRPLPARGLHSGVLRAY